MDLGLKCEDSSGKKSFSDRVSGMMAATLKYVAIILVSAIMALVIGEVYLQITLPKYDRRYILPPNYEATYTPTEKGTPGVLGGPALFVTNQHGLRGPEVRQADVTVVVFGGSTSIDIWLKESWPRVLERKMREFLPEIDQQVINISKWGLATTHNIIHLKEVVPNLPVKPDIVVVLAGANNMQMHMKTSYPDVIDDAFKLHVAYSITERKNEDSMSWSAIYRTYKKWRIAQRKRQTGPLLGGGGDWQLPLRECRQKAKDEDLVRETPDLTEGLAEYEADLREILDLSKGLGARSTVLATQPTLWRKDMPDDARALLLSGGVGALPDWVECEDGIRYYAPETQEAALNQFNQVMLKVCESTDAVCVDLEHSIPKEAEYFYDDMHYTERGAEAVADEIVPFVGSAIGSMTRSGQFSN